MKDLKFIKNLKLLAALFGVSISLNLMGSIFYIANKSGVPINVILYPVESFRKYDISRVEPYYIKNKNRYGENMPLVIANNEEVAINTDLINENLGAKAVYNNAERFFVIKSIEDPKTYVEKFIVKRRGIWYRTGIVPIKNEALYIVTRLPEGDFFVKTADEKIKQQPACCKQKADGQPCSEADECRGSCKCKFPTVAKKCAFGAGGVCQNQAKYCDVSKCVE